jgi:hypothetical protein
VKVASLFAQYLYTKHRLDLPGIGTFLLDPSVVTTLENSKQRSAVAEGITFESNASLKESPDLITFISAQTGKMKALAQADLESHLQLVQQFLNIGKPFIVEGVGTLSKKKPGEFGFTPLPVSAEKLKEYKTKEAAQTTAPPVTLEESSRDYESFVDPPKTRSWRKPVFATLILVVTGLAFWGAYTVSRSKKPVPTKALENTVVNAIPEKDSQEVIKDSAGTYKYVLETTGGDRAFKRYNQLRTFGWQVQLETRDSVSYKLFLLLPAVSADTARIIDSLTVMTGKRVYIE